MGSNNGSLLVEDLERVAVNLKYNINPSFLRFPRVTGVFKRDVPPTLRLHVCIPYSGLDRFITPWNCLGREVFCFMSRSLEMIY